MLSSVLSVFIKLSGTFSFIVSPSVDALVPIYALHVTTYVSFVSLSVFPLYMFIGFCFETMYLPVGLLMYFPTVTLKSV